MQAYRLGVLDRELAETADTRNGKPLAGLRLCLLDTLVRRNAGTKDGRQLCEVGVFG